MTTPTEYAPDAGLRQRIETVLRDQIADAMWRAAEHMVIAEWICCEPLDPRHDLCAKGYAALDMIRACILDSAEATKPAPLPDAALAIVLSLVAAERADAVRPRRGDAVEAWLKAQRDACFGHATSWGAVDGLLDEYRLHADTGTPLDQHACDGPHCDHDDDTARAAAIRPQDGEEA